MCVWLAFGNSVNVNVKRVFDEVYFEEDGFKTQLTPLTERS